MGFPALEVLAVSPASRVLEPGVRLALTTHYTVGRGAENDLVLSGVDFVSRRQFLVEQRYGRWWLLHLGAQDQTLHNGVATTNVELQHLDVIAVAGVFTLRFLERDEPDLREPQLEAAVLAAPHDETRWAVYADWLLEQGAALGERLSKPRVEHHGRWLGTLAPAWATGDLDVDWWHGLPRRVVVRRLLDRDGALPNPLVVVAATSVFRFLEAIEVDIEARARSHGFSAALGALLSPLKAAPLPLLKSVRVGPLTATPSGEDLEVLDALRTSRPGLVVETFALSPSPKLEVLSAPAAVQVTPGPGDAVPLVDGMLVGQLPTCAVQVVAPEGHPAGVVALQLSRNQGTWAVEDLFARTRPFRRLEFALKVNGHEVVHALLRPGDVLEPCAGLLLRLCA